jgi:hypothetical protein
MTTRNVNRRDFLKLGSAASFAALLAACGASTPAAAPTAAPAPEAPAAAPTAMPEPTTAPAAGAAMSMDDLVAAAKQEGTLSTIALPHDWLNYGEVIDGFKKKYGLEINELDPNAGSGDEVQAI